MEMDDGDHDSLLWSSDDTKSNDLSIVTTTTDLEENYFASPIVNILNIFCTFTKRGTR